jgi:hypothetical protein
MIVHKTQGSGISGTVRYVMGEGKRDPETGKVPQRAPGKASRVDWIGGTGFGFPIDSEERLDIARRVMEWAAHTQASTTKKCVDDCLHLVLAWEPGEQPTSAEMEAAAHSALTRLGMAKARAIFASHTDTDHRHLHLVISRINPENGKAFPDSFDTQILSAWALQWEQDHGGVRCEARLEKQERQAERDPQKIIEAYVARRETFTAFDLNRELTKAIPARGTRRLYIGQVLARADIVKLADPASGQVMRYTTRQTLAAEHLAEAAAARLYAKRSFQASEPALAAVLESVRAEGKTLRADQMEVLRHATGAEGLAIVVGKAGTGKSFAMASVAAAYAAEGYNVQSLAPTNKVASALRRDGLDARTIHNALGGLDRGKSKWNDRTVVMVDEAGMVSTRLMARVLSHAEHAGAKVILLGDAKQLASMERGGMFEYLAGLHGAGELGEVVRQRGAEQRNLAVRASQYDFGAALTILEGQGGIVTLDRSEDRIAKAAELWGTRRAQAPDRSLFVVTASNADAAAANRAMREIRRARGELGADHILPTVDGPQPFAQGDRILFSGSASLPESRDAGLVNGNAGIVTRIEGVRLSVALDGAKPGETVTFTVGKDPEAGEFDAIRQGLAGTIFKAQGATYDEVILIDSPSMRASAAYVALTRHRVSVQVVTARTLRPRSESWMEREGGGLDALSPAQRESAERSFEKWRVETNPKAGRQYGLANYVAYVQARESERRAQGEGQGKDIADMAKRWSRVEDRRAASRFEAQDYQAPDDRRLTPAEVRAAVGVERFEQDNVQQEPARGDAVTKEAGPAIAGAPASRAEEMKMEQISEETLLRQADIEAQRLRELQEQEDRAQAFRRAKQIEAEEAQTKQAEHRRQAEAHDGDISGAVSRYAIALGENYNVRDPYASLARAAMSEYAMFHRNQEKLRGEMAQERNPDKKRVIELRRTIEACDYMALTSERLAGISVAIVGRKDAPQAETDRTRAADYRAQAAALRTERTQLIEAIQHRVEITSAVPDGLARSPGATPSNESSQPQATKDPTPVLAEKGEIQPSVVTASPAPEFQSAKDSEPTEAVSTPSRQQLTFAWGEKPEPVSPADASSALDAVVPPVLVSVSPSLRRSDVIAPPPASQVTMAKSTPETPPETMSPLPAERRPSETPWLEALRQRVEEGVPPPDDTASERTMARFARRLQQGQSPPEAANDQARADPGPEPDM